MSEPKVQMSLHGPNVTAARAEEAGAALAKLLNEVAVSLGAPAGDGGFEVVGVYFQCDGCGLRRPDRPGPDEGWTFSDGDDFCPDCSAAAVSGVAGNPDKDGEK